MLSMETEIHTGMDDHVRILTNKIGHGGESILVLHNWLQRLGSRTEETVVGND